VTSSEESAEPAEVDSADSDLHVGIEGLDSDEFDIDPSGFLGDLVEEDADRDEQATDSENLFGVGAHQSFSSGSLESELETTLGSLEKVIAERDEYLDLVRRVQADFENYKRRVESQRVEQTERAAESLVAELLPVLDACEAAAGHGSEEVAPIQQMLVNTLSKLGLEPLGETGVAFDPHVHDAVLSEPGDDEDQGPIVAEVLRTGYSWKQRVLRPAMVKVRG
jgi:molecular chaperone GrpE